MATAWSIFQKKIPNKINNFINATQWFWKPLRKFFKKTTWITSFVYLNYIQFLLEHYNRTWTINSTFSEGLERLLMSHFIWERNITFSRKLKTTSRKIIAMLLMAVSLIWSFLLLVSTNDIRKKHGLVNSETPRYWLIYLDLIYLQTIVHSAVQKKWQRKIDICHVFFFILLCPGQNYARHGGFYATMLLIMEATLSRVKDAAHREGNLCSRSRSIPLQNFGWPTRRVNYQGCWNSGFISQNLLNLSCQLIISRICWLVDLILLTQLE